jgi:hypothetical protein
MYKRTVGVFGALALGVSMLVGALIVPAASAATTRIVGNPATCPGATYPTINAAVAVAAPGDTIKVCAGTYTENVVVTKPLTFLGAQAGKDARFRNNPSQESIVNNGAGDFTLSGTANDVKIDGFTLSGAGAPPALSWAYGIAAFQGSSGLVVVNNVLQGNSEGMNYQNPDSTKPSRVQYNAFKNNTAGSPTFAGERGTGVFISNGPANNSSIVDNYFTGHTETAINFAGSPVRSVGLVVKRNVSVDDSTFVVAINSDGAVVAQNAVYVSPSAANGTGILDFGANNNLSIDSNLIYGGAASGTSGVRIADFVGSPSTNTTVTNNRIANRYNGVRLTAGTSTITGNGISGSKNDGILAQSGGNQLLRNNVSSSTVHDCEDQTVGTGTAGTANQWIGNVGQSNNSKPPAICPPGRGRGDD